MLWGRIRYNEQKRTWCIRGKFQGHRMYFSEIPTRGGKWIPCSTRELAEHLREEISKEMDRGEFNPARYRRAKPLHFEKFALQWLSDQKPNVKFSTWKTYRSYIHIWLIPSLGKEYIPDLSYRKIKQFFNAIPKSPKYKQNIHALLREILNDARKDGCIAQLPESMAFDIPQVKIKFLDGKTQDKILEKIPEVHRYIFRFIFNTGVRISEARALRKVDIKDDHIVISQTFAPSEAGGEQLQIVKQKKEESIPISDVVRELLSEIPASLSPFVFLNPSTGRPYGKNINADVWNPASKEALGYVFPLNNAGRHSFGMAMAKAGVDMDMIAKLLRHSDVKITKKHYAEHDMGVMKRAVDNVFSLHKKP
jgi:integrase